MDAWRGSWILLILAVCLGALAVRAAIDPATPLAEITPRRPSEAGSGLPQVRVLIGSSARPGVRLRIEGPYRVLARDDWRVVAQGKRLGETEVKATDDGLQIGELKFQESRLKVEVSKHGSLWVDRGRYRGSLMLVRRDGGHVAVINHVDLEPYVASVVNGEMPEAFPVAARQAQAIAARSYVLYQIKARGAARDFDVFDNARSQVYQGMERMDRQGKHWAVETANSRRVAEETQGTVLLYQGRLFCPYYGAVCGGHTGRGSDQFSDAAPPLVGVACEGCRDAPRYRWQVETLTEPALARLTEYLDRTGRSVGRIEQVSVVAPAAGRLGEVTVVGERGQITLSSATFRQEVAGSGELPSPYYVLSWRPPRVIYEGRGWGHCVGLCQWGARGMAQQGSDCAAILAHYYPGSTLGVTR